MKTKDTLIAIRLDAEERKKFTKAAEREHMTLSAWLRWVAWNAVLTKEGRDASA